MTHFPLEHWYFDLETYEILGKFHESYLPLAYISHVCCFLDPCSGRYLLHDDLWEEMETLNDFFGRKYWSLLKVAANFW